VFFQLPQYPHFFSELCNFLRPAFQNRKGGGSEGNMTITVLYGRHDAQRLAGAVGTERAVQLLNAEKNVHMFVAGS
jgi:U3 small nucleolar RNA-associated protein 25